MTTHLLLEHSEYKESAQKSFLVKKSVKDKTAKLKFDVVLDVLNTQIEIAQALAEAQEIKVHNEKILTLIGQFLGSLMINLLIA